VRQAFAREGIRYREAEMDKSTAYLEAEPLLTQQRVELLDHPTLVRELSLLERRPRAQGRTLVDHPVGGHDDYANVACLAIAVAAKHAGHRPFTLSCAGQTITMDESGAVAPSVEVAPGVVVPVCAQPDLAEAVRQIRLKPIIQRTAEEAALVEQFFEAQAQRLNALDPLSRSVLSGGGYIPGEGASELEADLREVGEIFRRWR
jgi:hypothetical protein